MKKILIPVCIILLMLIQACGSSKETNSTTHASTEKYDSRYLSATADGKMDEWGDKLSYDNSSKCIYSIANDSSALYIAIKVLDRTQQMKMVQGGMEIWIDSKAKKTKSTGVKFPVGGSAVTMPVSRNNNNPDPKEMRQQTRAQMLTMELTGFKEGLNGSQSVYSDIPVKPVADWDKDNLVYELVIPFSALNDNIAANLNNISIGIFINGVKLPESGGMPGGGMPVGGPPGGMRPLGGGGSMPDRTQMNTIAKDDFFWTKYTIAKTK